MREGEQAQTIFEEALRRALARTAPREGFSALLVFLSPSQGRAFISSHLPSEWPPQVVATLARRCSEALRQSRVDESQEWKPNWGSYPGERTDFLSLEARAFAKMGEVEQARAVFDEALHVALSRPFPLRELLGIANHLAKAELPGPLIEALLPQLQTHALPLSSEFSVWCACMCHIATGYVIVQQLETAQEIFQEIVERDPEQPDQKSARREALAKALIEAAHLSAQTTDSDSSGHL